MSAHFPARLAAGALLACGLLCPTPVTSQETDAELQRLLVHATQALQRGELDLAEESFAGARDLEPSHARPWIGLSQVAEGRGAIVTALELAREAAARAPDHPGVALLEGRLLARLRRVDGALAALERARALGPGVADPYLLAALLLRDAGRSAEGIEILEQGVAAGVEDPAAIEQLGLLLLSAERHEQARALAEAHLEKRPDDSRLLAVHGMALARLGEQPENAARQLQRALELGSVHRGQIQLELGTLWIEAGRLQEASEQLEQAAALIPRSPEVYYRLATARRLLGDATGARSALQRFQELQSADDREDWAEKRLGTALNEAQQLAADNRLDAALERVDQILAGAPDEDRAHALRAKVLFSSGRPEEALAALLRARTLMPSRVEYHYLEGTFLQSLKRFDEAERALHRALALDPDLGEAHTLLGLIAAEQQRHQPAIDHLRRALELGSEGPALRLAYARALAASGLDSESEAQMESYRRLVER